MCTSIPLLLANSPLNSFQHQRLFRNIKPSDNNSRVLQFLWAELVLTTCLCCMACLYWTVSVLTGAAPYPVINCSQALFSPDFEIGIKHGFCFVYQMGRATSSLSGRDRYAPPRGGTCQTKNSQKNLAGLVSGAGSTGTEQCGLGTVASSSRRESAACPLCATTS